MLLSLSDFVTHVFFLLDLYVPFVRLMWKTFVKLVCKIFDVKISLFQFHS